MPVSLTRLTPAETRQALDVTVAIATTVALVGGTLLLRRPRPEERPSGSREAPPPPLSFWLHPLPGFLLICAALLLNQLLLNAYILRVHHGDPSFVARHLGPGWFALATGAGPVRWLAQHLPEDLVRTWLPYTVLRVQAALELPFTLLAYFSVVALLDEAVYVRLARSALTPLAAVAFTATFCYIELRLFNPWTESDLRVRWLACAVTVLLLLGQRAALRERQAGPGIAVSAVGLPALLLLLAGGGAVGLLVLCLYDVALLYNLGHLGARLPIMAAATALAAIAAVVRPRLRAPADPAPGLLLLANGLALFSAVFLVPSLTIRYCGARPSAAGAAAALLLFAALGGLRLGAQVLRARGVAPVRGVISLAVGLFIGAAAAHGAWAHGWLAAPPDILELTLLLAAVAGLLPAVVTARLIDELLTRVSRPGR